MLYVVAIKKPSTQLLAPISQASNARNSVLCATTDHASGIMASFNPSSSGYRFALKLLRLRIYTVKVRFRHRSPGDLLGWEGNDRHLDNSVAYSGYESMATSVKEQPFYHSTMKSRSSVFNVVIHIKCLDSHSTGPLPENLVLKVMRIMFQRTALYLQKKTSFRLPSHSSKKASGHITNNSELRKKITSQFNSNCMHNCVGLLACFTVCYCNR